MNLTDPIFTDKNAARQYLEASRWSNGVYCPHCGGTEKNKRLEGKSHRPSLYQCGDCRQQFTVTVGTVFERSKVPLNKWLLATFLMASSKKGISAHQLHRTIGVTYKTAWFMFHRIREAMRNDSNVDFGVGGGTVEVDETFFGNEKGKEVRRGYGCIFRDIRPPIPTTSAHLYRGIRPALTRCREALVFDISFLAFRHVVEGLSFGRIVRRVRAGRRCAPAGRGWHLRRWVHQ